jgi:aldose 1-epimerase
LNLSNLNNISDHRFQLNTDSFVIVDSQNIPTGEVKTLNKPLEYQLDQSLHPEFIGLCDHHFNTPAHEPNSVREMLTVFSPDSGVKLVVSGNSTGFQFYTGKFLSAPFAPSGGFCVETQLAPDAINQPNFYSPLLHPNQQREQVTQYQFSLAQIN